MVFGLKTQIKFCSVLFSRTCFSSDMLRASPDPSGGAGLRIQQHVCGNREKVQDKMFVFCPVKPCKLVVKLTALSSFSEFIPGQAVGKQVLLESPAAQARPRTRGSLFSCGGVGVFPLCTPRAFWYQDWMCRSRSWRAWGLLQAPLGPATAVLAALLGLGLS